MNRNSKILLLIDTILSAFLLYINFSNKSTLEIIIYLISGFLGTFVSIFIVYYLSYYLLKIIIRKDVSHKTELLNMIFIMMGLSFILIISTSWIKVDLKWINVISELITALGYYYFGVKIEKIKLPLAAIYAISVVIVQSFISLI